MLFIWNLLLTELTISLGEQITGSFANIGEAWWGLQSKGDSKFGERLLARFGKACKYSPL